MSCYRGASSQINGEEEKWDMGEHVYSGDKGNFVHSQVEQQVELTSGWERAGWKRFNISCRKSQFDGGVSL
jgi:hypothetical protein